MRVAAALYSSRLLLCRTSGRQPVAAHPAQHTSYRSTLGSSGHAFVVSYACIEPWLVVEQMSRERLQGLGAFLLPVFLAAL